MDGDAKRRKGLDGNRIIPLTDDNLVLLAILTPLPDDDDVTYIDNSVESPSSPMIDVEILTHDFQPLAPMERLPILTDDDLDEILSSTPFPDDDKNSNSLLDDDKMSDISSDEFIVSSDDEEVDDHTLDSSSSIYSGDSETDDSTEEEGSFSDITETSSSEDEADDNQCQKTKKTRVKYLVEKLKSRPLIPNQGRNKRQQTAADFEYRVSWVGYSESDDTWELYENIKHLLNTSRDDVTNNNVYEVDKTRSV